MKLILIGVGLIILARIGRRLIKADDQITYYKRIPKLEESHLQIS